jgi:phage virion morphogenesis protein
VSDFAQLESYCSALIADLEPAQRRQLAREIAKGLRDSQSRRIATQLNPDGTAYAPRKPQLSLRGKKGSTRRRAMFSKLRTSRFLKMESNADRAVIAFTAEVQGIAQVHHYGLRDKVNRRRSIEVKYPSRELLGITNSDYILVESLVLHHLAR